MTNRFKSFFQALALFSVALGTTYCSKERPAPNATPASEESRSAAQQYPLGFNPKECGVDSSGIAPILYKQAREQAHASGVSDEDFDAIKEKLLSQRPLEFNSEGHIAESVSPYAARVNNFTDNVRKQLDAYDDYVQWAASQGYDAQNPDDIKSLITEQFDATIPAQDGDKSLTERDREQLKTIADAAKPRIAQAFELFDALYKCEAAASKLQGGSTAPSAQRSAAAITFKQYLELRKEGKIQSRSSQRVTGFWSSLVKAVHVVVTVVVHTVVGVVVGAALGGTSAGAGAVVGGVFGFISGIVNVSKGFCLFGHC